MSWLPRFFSHTSTALFGLSTSFFFLAALSVTPSFIDYASPRTLNDVEAADIFGGDAITVFDKSCVVKAECTNRGDPMGCAGHMTEPECTGVPEFQIVTENNDRACQGDGIGACEYSDANVICVNKYGCTWDNMFQMCIRGSYELSYYAPSFCFKPGP